jgi:hypothetical protein
MSAEQSVSEFSRTARHALERAGWGPGRAVSEEQLAAWEAAIAKPMHSRARDALREFGGLEIGAEGPGIERARDRLNLDPRLAIGEEDRLELFEDTYRLENLYPLGEGANGHYFVAMDTSGSVYMIADFIFRVGHNMHDAIESSILGLAVEALD